MKKGVLILLLFVCNILLAQTNPQLPTLDSRYQQGDAHNLISNYQSLSNVDIHPYSFIINTTDIKAYFNAHPGQNTYFHIYLSYDTNDSLQLVIVPCLTLNPTPGSTILTHDINYGKAFIPCSMEGNPSFCYVSDNLDLSSNQFPASNPPCDLTKLDCSNSTVSEATEKSFIMNYQIENTQEHHHLESFTFSAVALQNYLNSNASVSFLQIYLGRNPAMISSNVEKYTLIFVGLNNSGIHQYETVGTTNFVYEQCMPCPECGVAFDNTIDFKPQATPALITQYKNEIQAFLNDSIHHDISNQKLYRILLNSINSIK